ncbi:MAG TPA: tetratricopeptide repeat protein, partial [Bryobacteraceae bacterium]|nr:tetratricopeptide repeat protein [Bryobacteraceae bacterium]
MAIKLKSSLVSYFFGFVKGLSEHGPAMADAAGAAGAAMPLVYPAAILATALGDGVAEYVRNRKKPDDLAELYRESLLRAIKTCIKDFEGLAAEDRDIVDLWEEGLDFAVKGDPLWKTILEDTIPTRMLSVDLNEASSHWPLLRAQLEVWTNWFRYRRTAGTAPQGFNIPRQPLVLSRDFDRYLAANLPRELMDHFQPELASGHHRDAFNKTLLRALNQLSEGLRPLDPVRHIGEFPKPEEADTALKLLDARYRVTPYIGRRGDLDALWTWLQSPAPASCQVVMGRGGNGKTRLGYQLLEEIDDREPLRWHAGLLEYQRFQDELGNEKFRKWRGRKPTLIVIDYADAAAPLLEQYIIPELAHSGLGQDDVPIRFLLLARTADEAQGWYKTLRRAAGSSQGDLFPNPPLVLRDLDPAQRRELAQAMLTAASHVEKGKRLTLPPVGLDTLIDDRLEANEFADPLILCMAAIVAHSRQSLTALHLHRTDLARGMAIRERRRLENLVAKPDKALLLHMAAYVNLSGRMVFNELENATKIEKGHLDSDGRVGEIPGLLAPGGVAEPIVPDIIGEAFLHDVLREDQQHGPETVMRAAALRPGPVTRALVRTVQDFEPDRKSQSTDDEQCQRWALTRLTAVLTEHAQAISDDVFWEIHGALTLDTVAMILPSRDFYQAICALRYPSTSLVGVEALNTYAIYESKTGNRGKALVAIRQAVEIRRELVGKNREAFLSDLAMSLNNQANRQSEMGQRAEALQSIQEAVERYRELVGKNREAFLPDVA